MQSYPYRLVGDSGRAAVRQKLNTVLDAWSSEWFVSPPTYEARIDDVIPDSVEWRTTSVSIDNWAATYLKDRTQRDFMQLLFGSATGTAPSTLLADVWHECVSDLMKRLVPTRSNETALLESLSLDGLHTGAGSGALHVRLEGNLPLQGLALGGAWVEAIAAQALSVDNIDIALAPRREVLSSGKIKVELKLGDAEVSLSDLANIAVGDVLALDISHDVPLQLSTTDGRSLFHVHLGRMGQQKAIQIISK